MIDEDSRVDIFYGVQMGASFLRVIELDEAMMICCLWFTCAK